MTQPDPDPTNRELVRALAEHTSKLSIHTMHQFLAAADAAGYQIVPKGPPPPPHDPGVGVYGRKA